MQMTTGFLLLLFFISSSSTIFAKEYTQRELAYMPAAVQIELFKRGDITQIDVLLAQNAHSA